MAHPASQMRMWRPAHRRQECSSAFPGCAVAKKKVNATRLSYECFKGGPVLAGMNGCRFLRNTSKPRFGIRPAQWWEADYCGPQRSSVGLEGCTVLAGAKESGTLLTVQGGHSCLPWASKNACPPTTVWLFRQARFARETLTSTTLTPLKSVSMRIFVDRARRLHPWP